MVPLSWLWAVGGVVRRAVSGGVLPRDRRPFAVCVGDAVMGGGGKTPVCMALAEALSAVVVCRGYGGSEVGPYRVHPDDQLERVGDEALEMVRRVPCIVARNRLRGQRHGMTEMSAELVVHDGGLMNPTMDYDLRLLVLEAEYGLGNGRRFPAGPLRRGKAACGRQIDGVIVLGPHDLPEGQAWLEARDMAPEAPWYCARTEVQLPEAAAGSRPWFAFAGIGRPEKFFAALERAGVSLAGHWSFADHYRYHDRDVRALAENARARGARLVTTAKDATRLPPAWRQEVAVAALQLVWAPGDLVRLLTRIRELRAERP